MFTEYSDIFDRIAEPPKWWDEQGVPRYCEFSPYKIANIYAGEAVLLEIMCFMCGRRFEAALCHPPGGLSGTMPAGLRPLREEIVDGSIDYCDPPNYGCRDGAGTGCYNLRVLQYWSRQNATSTWTRDPQFEIDLPESKELPIHLR